MTTPTHVSKIPPGGILTQNVDLDWADYAAGRPVTQRVVAAVIQASKISSGNTQSGRTKGVGYEDVHFVEITDAHEADKVRRLITVAMADRGLRTSQPTLFDLTEAEQCDSLNDMIKEAAGEAGWTPEQLNERWWNYFGGADADGLAETPAACRSALQLKEFAYEIGAIADPEPEPSEAPTVPFSDGTPEEADDEDPA